MKESKKKKGQTEDLTEIEATSGAELLGETTDSTEVSAPKEKAKKEPKEEKDDLLEKVGTGEIVYVPISRLTLLEANPRLIGKSELTKLSNSIEADKAYFESRPCLVNLVNGVFYVYAGNMRVRASIMLGWRLVPCIIDELDSELQDVRMFKDNMHAGEFNMKLLLKSFELGYLQFDVGMNFTKSELSKFLKEDKKRKGSEDFEDEEGNFGMGSEFEEEEEEEDEENHLFIAGKFTNGTKPDALHFRQWEIPLSKGDAIWFQELLADYRTKNKTLTNFWAWFRETILDHES